MTALINLLPHREMARKRRLELFKLSLGLSVAAGVLLAGLVYLWLQGQISAQQQTNQLLQSEIKVLEKQIQDIAMLEAEITALRARQQAVEDLQADRNLPVHLLTELARQVPDGVNIASMKQEGLVVALQGTALSNERVSELLRNLAYNTPWFTKPELGEIVAGSVMDGRRTANFTLRVRLIKPSQLPQAAASAPASSASAAASAAALPRAAASQAASAAVAGR